jgi:hypothetical protein
MTSKTLGRSAPAATRFAAPVQTWQTRLTPRSLLLPTSTLLQPTKMTRRIAPATLAKGRSTVRPFFIERLSV